MDSAVKLGKTYTSILARDRYNDVEQGIHSLRDKQGVDIEMDYFGDDDYRVVRCIIPKGSKYYVGYFDVVKSIASDTIKYIEFI